MTPMARVLFAAALAAVFVLTGLPFFSDAPQHGFPVKSALAEDDDRGDDDGDDDDDDDDDDGDDDDGEDDDDVDAAGTDSRESRRDGYDAGREILAIDVDPAVIQSLEADGFVVRESRSLPSLRVSISRLAIPSSANLPAALARARQLAPGIAYEPNPIYQLADAGPGSGQVAALPCNGLSCYPFELVGWPSNPETCGAGLRIGMTDTAVDPDHPALRGRAVNRRRFAPDGADDRSPTDHGTAVAALMIGDPASGFPGMLPSATLFAADVFHVNDAGRPQATLAELVTGLDWLAAQDVSVINVSMTGPPNQLLGAAVRTLDERGIAVVAAAGNGGPGAAPAFPAAYDSVVSVTAVDQDRRPYRLANRGEYIALASPGVAVWSAADDGAGEYRTGTSVAAAHVSAAIAEIIGDDRANPGSALRILRRDAIDLGAPGRDRVFGWGLIQASPTCRG